MVRALLNTKIGEVAPINPSEPFKGQTRRIVKPQPAEIDFANTPFAELPERAATKLPYPPGQILYVKETWRPASVLSPWDLKVTYAADGEARIIKDGEFGDGSEDWIFPKAAARGNVSPLFMPKWASRIWLEVTAVRVERLQEISEAEAIAEGLSTRSKDGKTWKWGIPDSDGLPGNDDDGWHWHEWDQDPRKAYQRLWESINGPGSWDANPWVWVYNFTKIEKS